MRRAMLERVALSKAGVRRMGVGACVVAVSVLLAACSEKPAEAPSPEAMPSAPATAPVNSPEAPAAPVPPVTSSTPAPQLAPSAGATAQLSAEPRKLPLSVQGVSSSGATVRVKGIEIGTDATVLDVSMSFSNRITNSTMMALTDTFLEDETGARLQIKRPDDNRNLTIHAGDTLNGQLVFMGAVPASARTLRLVFNEGNPDDNIVAPGLTIDLPLQGG